MFFEFPETTFLFCKSVIREVHGQSAGFPFRVVLLENKACISHNPLCWCDVKKKKERKVSQASAGDSQTFLHCNFFSAESQTYFKLIASSELRV